MRSTTLAAWLALFLAPMVRAEPPGDRLVDQVIKAYRDVHQYEAILTFQVSQQLGRWHNLQTADFFYALDRTGDAMSLKIDTPDLYTVVKDGTHYFRSDQIPGRHMAGPAPSPLTYEKLLESLLHNGEMLLADPVMIDVAFLLADDPIDAISLGAASRATPLNPDPADPRGRPRLEIAMPGAKATLSIDPKSKLIMGAVIEQSTVTAPGDYLRFKYEYEIKSVNQPPATPDAFAFDTSTQAFKSLSSMIGGGGGRREHPTVGRPAPDVRFKALDDNAVDLRSAGEVIVLDFWATWCGPCAISLAAMQTIHDWARKEKLPVAIYAVNVAESEDDINRYFEQANLTLPVLMDPNGDITFTQFAAAGLPHTVFIVDGEIKHVETGFMADATLEQTQRNVERQYRELIEQMLAESAKDVPAAEAASTAAPD